jgi:hypothetical protein
MPENKSQQLKYKIFKKKKKKKQETRKKKDRNNLFTFSFLFSPKQIHIRSIHTSRALAVS